MPGCCRFLASRGSALVIVLHLPAPPLGLVGSGSSRLSWVPMPPLWGPALGHEQCIPTMCFTCKEADRLDFQGLCSSQPSLRVHKTGGGPSEASAQPSRSESLEGNESPPPHLRLEPAQLFWLCCLSFQVRFMFLCLLALI